jgi:hypothetical protein
MRPPPRKTTAMLHLSLTTVILSEVFVAQADEHAVEGPCVLEDGAS